MYQKKEIRKVLVLRDQGLEYYVHKKRQVVTPVEGVGLDISHVVMKLTQI